jgi:hypothetical protein
MFCSYITSLHAIKIKTLKSETYLKEKTNLTDDELKMCQSIDQRIQSRFSDKNKANSQIIEILNLMHSAFQVDKEKYISDIFFEFYILREKTIINLKRIYYELSNLNKFQPNSEAESNHLINIYRNLVSDLFDPYISLLKASLQFVGGNFISFLDSNLGQGERNKYEFCLSRMKPTTIFDGYNPIVRNAISHTGSDSIRITETEIIFKNIKRGNPPIVTSVKWTSEELQQNILELLNFINLIDSALEIFGFDITEIIKSSEGLNFKFLDQILVTKERLSLQSGFDEIIDSIVNKSDFDLQQKLDALTTFYFLESKKRNLNVNRNLFNTKDKIVMIEIPKAEYDLNNDDDILSRFLEMLGFGILAEPCYRNWAKMIAIIEVDGEENELCKIVGKVENFREYNFEKAGIVDLANDLNYYFKGNKAEIVVNFEKAQEMDDNSLGRIFPRKKR